LPEGRWGSHLAVLVFVLLIVTPVSSLLFLGRIIPESRAAGAETVSRVPINAGQLTNSTKSNFFAPPGPSGGPRANGYNTFWYTQGSKNELSIRFSYLGNSGHMGFSGVSGYQGCLNCTTQLPSSFGLEGSLFVASESVADPQVPSQVGYSFFVFNPAENTSARVSMPPQSQAIFSPNGVVAGIGFPKVLMSGFPSSSGNQFMVPVDFFSANTTTYPDGFIHAAYNYTLAQWSYAAKAWLPVVQGPTQIIPTSCTNPNTQRPYSVVFNPSLYHDIVVGGGGAYAYQVDTYSSYGLSKSDCQVLSNWVSTTLMVSDGSKAVKVASFGPAVGNVTAGIYSCDTTSLSFSCLIGSGTMHMWKNILLYATAPKPQTSGLTYYVYDARNGPSKQIRIGANASVFKSDGDNLVFVQKDGSGNYNLFLYNSAIGAPKQLTTSAQATPFDYHAVVSGRYVAWVNQTNFANFYDISGQKALPGVRVSDTNAAAHVGSTRLSYDPQHLLFDFNSGVAVWVVEETDAGGKNVPMLYVDDLRAGRITKSIVNSFGSPSFSGYDFHGISDLIASNGWIFYDALPDGCGTCQLEIFAVRPTSIPSYKLIFYVQAPGPLVISSSSPFIDRYTGHGFMQFRTDVGQQAGRSDLVYGKGSVRDVAYGGGYIRGPGHPEPGNWDLKDPLTGQLRFYSPGGLLINGIAEADHDWTWRIVYNVTAQQYNSAASYVNGEIQNPSPYGLLRDNCVDWIVRVAKAAGVTIPSMSDTGLFHPLIPISDPGAAANSLAAIGDGGSFHGGKVLKNTNGLTPRGTPDPPTQDTLLAGLDTTVSLLLRNSSALASFMNVTLVQKTIAPVNMGTGGQLALALHNVNLNNSLAVVDFGDGSQVQTQLLSLSHSFSSPGTYHSSVFVLNSGAIDKFLFDVNVAGGSSNLAEVSIEVPNPIVAAPTPPFPPVEPVGLVPTTQIAVTTTTLTTAPPATNASSSAFPVSSTSQAGLNTPLSPNADSSQLLLAGALVVVIVGALGGVFLRRRGRGKPST